jgi:uncharacterized protein YyaL (SSP411 family)
MNQLFVNIKVDREERPTSTRSTRWRSSSSRSGSGGWPLTMFLTPDDQQPFLRRHVFPKEPRYGMPAFKAICCERVAEYYHGHGADRRQNAQLETGVRRPHRAERPAGRGGFGRRAAARGARGARALVRLPASAASPKRRNFRIPAASSVACGSGTHRGRASPDLKALYMASLTLTRMAEGGLYDQLGGGFSRYSVDAAVDDSALRENALRQWQLLCEYARAPLATGEASVRAHRRRNRRLGAARHALTGRRLLFQPRRGFGRS